MADFDEHSSGSSTFADNNNNAGATEARDKVQDDYPIISKDFEPASPVSGGQPDSTFPFDTVNIERAEFPAEYETETATGLVPISSLSEEVVQNSTSNRIYRTETAQSLASALSRTATTDFNFPFATERADHAEFPDEYTSETFTGLVPQSTIRSYRGNAGPFEQISEENEKGENEVEYVTFLIGDKENPMVCASVNGLYT